MLSRGVAAARIEAEAERRGHHLGWRLLMSPWSTVTSARVAIITMNPGTPRDSAKVASADEVQPNQVSVEGGSAYRLESWWQMPAGTAPHQRQLLRLIELAGEEPDAVLAGNLVPFASRSWSELPDHEEALGFGVDLWRELLDGRKPERVFVLGGEIFSAFKGVLGAGEETHFPSGWGNIKLRRATFQGGFMVGLPHLSRFKLFRHDGAVSDRERLFQAAASLI